MKTGTVMAGLALAGLAAAWPGPWHPGTRVAAVRLGVRVVATTAQLRKTFGVNAGKGALALDVEPDGPAGRAGLQAGGALDAAPRRAVGGARGIPRRRAARQAARR